MTDFKTGDRISFDLTNQEHARFLFGEHAPAVKNPNEKKTVVCVAEFNPKTNTIHFVPVATDASCHD